MMGVKVSLRVNPEIAELLHGEENHLIIALEKIIGKQIVIYPNTQFLTLLNACALLTRLNC
jgi:ribonuclease G